SDVDIVFPIALVGGGDIADIGARKKNQCAQVSRTHLVFEFLQTIFTQTIEIDAILPVRSGLAVNPTRIPLMWLADETRVHCLSPKGNHYVQEQNRTSSQKAIRLLYIRFGRPSTIAGRKLGAGNFVSFRSIQTLILPSSLPCRPTCHRPSATLVSPS